MPKDTSIKKVLVIGSGPIVIGQAAEFDYAGAQACRVLKAEGINVVLVNSNPATIMTDQHLADEIYLEPLNAGRTYITSQNHGYAVVADSLKGIGKESFRNANDGSCEGMDYPDLKCFTVQFHPEAASGPRDTAVLFDRFVENMVKGGKENA